MSNVPPRILDADQVQGKTLFRIITETSDGRVEAIVASDKGREA